MQVISVVSQKGGVGKTTLALHIAVAAQMSGRETVVLDMDPQGTAERWGEWRKELPPIIISAKSATLGRRLEQAEKAGAKYVVIDTPPLGQSEAREAARVANLIIVPCRPAAFDLDAIRLTAGLAKDSGKPAFVVVNAGPPTGTAIFEDVKRIVNGFGLEMCPFRMSDRAAFRHAVGQGLTAQEVDKAGSRAASEIVDLFRWVHETLEIRPKVAA